MPEIDLTQNIIPSGQLIGTLAVGAGTTDYNALENKPQINSVTLSGNKTGADLGLVSASDLATVATTGSYADLLDKPVYTQVINLGYNTANKVINTTSLADILNNPTTVTTAAGTYTYMIILNAGWEIASGNFYTALNVDGSNNNANTTYAAPQANSMCIFFGEITLTAGQHTINVKGRVSGTAGKEVTIPSYASVTVLLVRK